LAHCRIEPSAETGEGAGKAPAGDFLAAGEFSGQTKVIVVTSSLRQTDGGAIGLLGLARDGSPPAMAAAARRRLQGTAVRDEISFVTRTMRRTRRGHQLDGGGMGATQLRER
jgi:hypothetical protein